MVLLEISCELKSQPNKCLIIDSSNCLNLSGPHFYGFYEELFITYVRLFYYRVAHPYKYKYTELTTSFQLHVTCLLIVARYRINASSLFEKVLIPTPSELAGLIASITF